MSDVAIYDFACERADLFECLKDQDFFRDFVTYQYQTSLANTALEPRISEYACNLAFAQFTSDVKRMLASEYEGEGQLDHFKQASFMVFWLRRHSPISEVFLKRPEQAILPVKIRSEQPKEVHYYYLNQNVSFDIGFRIIRFWEAQRKDSTEIYGREVSIEEFSMLGESTRNKSLLKDLVQTLASKSISPHSLWMIYRAFFHQIILPRS